MAKSLKNIPLSGVNGGIDHAVLTSKEPQYQFVDGRPVGDPTGTRVTVALQGNAMEPLRVDIEGADKIPDITDEVINQACKELKFIRCKFSGMSVSIYKSKTSNSIGMSATADGIEILPNNAK